MINLNMQPHDAIEQMLREIDAPADTKRQYAERLVQGQPTRDENPTTHFCSYFLPYRLSDQKIFLEAHKKSGLWLAPGGHIDPGETPLEAAERELDEELSLKQSIEKAKFLTITYIKRDVRACTIHYDIWHFVPIEDGVTLPTTKEGEFDDARWFSLDEARKVVTDESNLKAIDFVEKIILR